MAKPTSLTTEQIQATIGALYDESDRGAAVLAGSMVENALGTFLEEYCGAYADRKTVEKLFGASGPISTFAQRTLIAACFGLISNDDKEQLDIVREIRNHFAHHPLEASFDDPLIKSKTDRLGLQGVPLHLDPTSQTVGPAKMAYLIRCAFLIARFHEAVSE